MESALSIFHICVNWTFFASCYGCGTIKRNLSKSAFSEGVGHFERKLNANMTNSQSWQIAFVKGLKYAEFISVVCQASLTSLPASFASLTRYTMGQKVSPYTGLSTYVAKCCANKTFLGQIWVQSTQYHTVMYCCELLLNIHADDGL